VTISSCFFWLVYKDLPVALADFKESLKKGWFNIKSKSTLLKIGQLFAFGVFFNIAYNLIVLIFLGEGILPAETEVSPAWFFLSLVASAAATPAPCPASMQVIISSINAADSELDCEAGPGIGHRFGSGIHNA